MLAPFLFAVAARDSYGPVVLHRSIMLGMLSLSLAGACSSDDPELERKGGPIPEPPSPSGGTSGAPAAGDAGAGAVAGAGDDLPIAFCDALAVVRAKCQRCHGQPLANGAPVPFMTYEDFNAPYGSSGSTYGEVAVRLVEEGIMPYVTLNDPPTSLMPPVVPLTASEKATLLGWLKQGRQAIGGTDCP